MTRKVYRSKQRMSISILVTVDGVEQYVDFTGGTNSPQRVNGSYSTNNSKMQAAIEKHPGFKRTFELIKTIDTTPAPVPVKEPVKEPVEKSTDVNINDPFISRAKTFWEAKQELNQKFKVSHSRIKNAAAVREMAKQFNVEYPNWGS
jgi:hypothetical protein